jgi:hypothetical protein
MRIRDKWRTSASRSVEDKATAAAYIVWQLGLHFTRHLHEERFDYESDDQRISVIREYLIFLTHVTDRLTYQTLSDQDREIFMNALAEQVARHYQSNVEGVAGSGDYRTSFLNLMNTRFEAYAKGKFEDGEPGYAARRLVGNMIQDIMGNSQTNRWVIQQVVDIDAPDAASQLRQSVSHLFSQPQ